LKISKFFHAGTGVAFQNLSVLKIVPVGILFLAWVGILLFLGPDFGLEGDDQLILSQPYVDIELSALNNFSYLSLAATRKFLILGLIGLFNFAGKNPIFLCWGFLILWLLTSILCFRLLNNFYPSWIALLASLFFLGYAGKFEIVTVLSGGFYHIVLLCQVLILLILVSTYFSWPVKSIFISLLFWISLHFYEILFLTAPLLGIYYFFCTSKKILKSSLSGYIYSALPTVIAITHLLVLRSLPNPIWERSGPQTLYQVLEKIPKIFAINLDAIFGPRHWDIVFRNLNSFYERFQLGMSQEIVYGTILIVSITILAVGMALKSKETNSNFSCNNVVDFNRLALNVFSVYCIFLATLVSWPVVILGDFTPSRFTYLPSLGLAILFAQFMHLKGWKGLISICFIGLLVLIQFIALRFLLVQYSETAKIDNMIRAQLQAFQLDWKVGDSIFMSLPRQRFQHQWNEAPSKFGNGNSSIALLLIDYPKLVDDGLKMGFTNDKLLNYSSHMRPLHAESDKSFILFLEPNAPPDNKLYAFILRDDLILCGVPELVFINEQKEVILRKKISDFSKIANVCIAPIYLPFASIPPNMLTAK